MPLLLFCCPLVVKLPPIVCTCKTYIQRHQPLLHSILSLLRFILLLAPLLHQLYNTLCASLLTYCNARHPRIIIMRRIMQNILFIINVVYAAVVLRHLSSFSVYKQALAQAKRTVNRL